MVVCAAWGAGMEGFVTCPDCGERSPQDARFCSGCGRPRWFVVEELQEQARRTGASYTDLLDRARAETLANEPPELVLARLERRIGEIEHMLGSRPPASVPTSPVSPPVRPTPVVPAPPPEHVTRPAVPRRDLESWITGKLLAWVGGVAVAIGAIFFLSMAFSNGWISPAMRVYIGIGGSLAMLAIGGWFFNRREKVFGHVLVATSLGILILSLVAGTRLYDLFSPLIGMLAMAVAVALAAVIAIRSRLQIVALYGLVPGLISPILLDAPQSYSTVALIALMIAGMAAISLFQRWRWLPPATFLLTAPQVWSFLDHHSSPVIALLLLAGFWALYTFVASGEEFLRAKREPDAWGVPLLVANAAFLVGLGFMILSDDLHRWRGLFIFVVALVHGLLALLLLMLNRKMPYGIGAAATGVAALTLAIPVQLGGSVVTLAWAAEATALVWVYRRTSVRLAGFLAMAAGGLSVLHLLFYEYPFFEFLNLRHDNWPWISGAGLTTAFLLLALGTCWYLLQGSMFRPVIVISAGLLLWYTVPFELPRPAAVAAWSLVAVGWVLYPRLDQRGARLCYVAYAGVIALATTWTLVSIAMPSRLAVTPARVDITPFLNGATLALSSLIVALALGAWVLPERLLRSIAGILAGIATVYLASITVVDIFQSRVTTRESARAIGKQAQVALSILLAGGGILVFASGLFRFGRVVRSFGLALLAVATVKVFLYDLSSLDTTYRVLSFIGLGIILLAASFAYQRFMPLIEQRVG